MKARTGLWVAVGAAALAPERVHDVRAQDRSTDLCDRGVLRQLTVADPPTQPFGQMLLDPEAAPEMRADRRVFGGSGDE